jgi:hypothetical protein
MQPSNPPPSTHTNTHLVPPEEHDARAHRSHAEIFGRLWAAAACIIMNGGGRHRSEASPRSASDASDSSSASPARIARPAALARRTGPRGGGAKGAGSAGGLEGVDGEGPGVGKRDDLWVCEFVGGGEGACERKTVC